MGLKIKATATYILAAVVAASIAFSGAGCGKRPDNSAPDTSAEVFDTGTETAASTETETVTDTQTDTETAADTQTGTETVTETETAADTETESALSLARRADLRGIYVTAPRAGIESYRTDLENLTASTPLNAWVIDFKNEDGTITCKGVPFAVQEGIEGDYISDVKALIDELHSKGIYVIARIVSFKDNLAVANHPEMGVHNADGTLWVDKSSSSGNYTWLNPYRQDVWDYITNVALAAADCGFDEIQFDYVRFSTAKGIDACDFGDTNGMTREDAIAGFLSYAVEKLHAKGVYVSADVYGTIITSALDADLVGQDYSRLAGILDYISPMIYPSHYANGSMGIDVPDLKPYQTIYGAMSHSNDKINALKDAGKHYAIVRPWLQDFTAGWLPQHLDYGAEERKLQLEAVYDNGGASWLLWDAEVKYDAGGMIAPPGTSASTTDSE